MTDDKLKRIEIAASCKDCEYIPKVHNAGAIEIDENGKKYQVMHNGVKTYLDSHYGDFNVEIIKKLKGHHEPQEEKVFFEILNKLKPKSTMIELGAFWGYYSLWFKHTIKDSNVYLVEPMQMMLDFGVRNFKLNNLNGNFFKYAVGEKTIENIEFTHWDQKKYFINQINVDSFLELNNISNCDILHADIQGFEYEMLLGAKKSLESGSISFIFISTHSNDLHYKCLKLLKNFKYKILADHNLTESFASDGLIVASLDHIVKKIKISKKTSFITQVKKLKYKLFY